MRKQLATILRFLADRIDPPFAFEAALGSTQFADSGLVVNEYGVDLTARPPVPGVMLWALRTSNV